MANNVLSQALHQISPLADAAALRWEEHAARPAHLGRAFAGLLGLDPSQVLVAGPMDQRLLLVDRGATWALANLSGRPFCTVDWPTWLRAGVDLDEPASSVSTARVQPATLLRLRRPRVLLASLYHPEHFPLPRFPLAISDLARSARSTFSGTVDLMDMQLGDEIDDIVAAAADVDIFGLSATFGQYDLLIEVLERVLALGHPPLVVAGGSLTARVESLLLDRAPGLLLSHGAGESTITDLIAHWHGELPLERVRGIVYLGRRGEVRRNARPSRRRSEQVVLPELDLLSATLSRGGVAQIEASRGCTNYCSFCPRSHKGTWADLWDGQLEWVLTEIRRVFDRHPHRSRTLYVVDEEFVGRGSESAERALRVAAAFQQSGFGWETSCRVDQVVADKDLEWHANRAEMWRALVDRGLQRCLFGLESGVTSVLTRFNKETTGEQNTLAIRTLSALGVPTRFTYITFDHLMSFEELAQTYAYQGRTDLILKPLPDLSPEEIVNGVRDEAFVKANSAGVPLHGEISYMLVSMECLIGAPYTRIVEAAGLAKGLRASMGRVDAAFRDWRIGVCAELGQRWVDRSFALDYTLKSIEKIVDGETREAIRGTRRVMRSSGYELLGHMVGLCREFEPGRLRIDELRMAIRSLMDEGIHHLRVLLEPRIESLHGLLMTSESRVLARQFAAWRERGEWRLINPAELPRGSTGAMASTRVA